MKSRLLRTPNKYIMPLNVNTLRGNLFFKKHRSLSNKHILYIPDLQSNINLNYNIIQSLSNYGSVTSVDLPGIGGMESFYKIERKPTIEHYADYLASLIRLRYKNKKIILSGQGFGLIVITSMLQRYPIIAEQTKLIVSINGVARFDDYIADRRTRIMYSALGSINFLSNLITSLGLKNYFLEIGYSSKFEKNDISKELISSDSRFLNKSLHKNDLATHLFLLKEISKFDNCNNKRLDIPLWNIILKDTMIDKKVNEQHMKIIFKKYYQSSPKISHYDLFISNDKLISTIFNSKLKKLLLRKR